MAPALREAYDLDLKGVGLFIAAEWVGLTIALLPWGLVTDRIGERRALAGGLSVCGVLVCSDRARDSGLAAGALLALAAGAGASVQSASGRAVMQWFGPSERGLAFGVRQTAVPLGGVIGALVLPRSRTPTASGVVPLPRRVLHRDGGIGYAVVRDLPSEGVDVEEVESTLRDRRLWVLCGGSGLYVTAQMVLFSFLVLYLHDERGFSTTDAAGVLAARR